MSEVAASRARSISGSTAKNEPTTTAVQATTAADNASSLGGCPPAATATGIAGRMYIERMTPR